MGKFWDWLTDGDTGEEKPEVVSVSAKVEDTPAERGSFAKTKEDIEESKRAAKGWRFREEEAFKAYEPKGPAFKIVQVPAGHFVIQRRHTQRAYDPVRRTNYFGEQYHQWADEIEAMPVEPCDAYETVKNTDAPIMSKDYGYYGGRQLGDEYRLSGYADMAFNVFADAEAYLIRMATPENHEVGYDFPPLKRRTANSKKAPVK